MRKETLRMERVTYMEQGVTQLENFSMTIWEGEILGLVPVNHHGLPALIKLLRQNRPLRYGYIYYHERLINTWRGKASGLNRISIIQNKSCLAEDLTVADNIFVLRPGFRKRLINPEMLGRQLEPFLKEVDVEIRADEYVENLSPFQRFVVELLKAVVVGNRLIVLDDIGNFVSGAELEKIHKILKQYAAQGFSFLYIASHFEETRQICDRTALMLNGQITKCLLPSSVEQQLFFQCTENFERKVIEQMEKRETDENLENLKHPGAAFQVMDLCCDGEGGLNFSVAPGECLVLQDLEHCVYQGLLRVLSGERKPQRGSIWIGGQPFLGSGDRNLAIVRERAAESMLFSNLSYMDNLCFTLDHRFPDVWRRRRIRRSIRKEYSLVLGEDVWERSIDQLSEKQKYELVYMRILLQSPDVVFCVQPFKGAEASVRLRIWELLEQLLEKGIAVVILAVNLADSLALANRLLRIHQGNIVEEYRKEDFKKLPVTTPWLYLYQQKSGEKE